MSDWKELNDFSEYDVRIPCSLCQKDSEKTLVGNHFKCGTCDHLFNKDGSSLPEGVVCYCDICCPKKKKGPVEDLGKKEKKLINKVKKIIKKVTKKKG